MNTHHTLSRLSAWAGVLTATIWIGAGHPAAWSYGKEGHQVVGAIADDLIAGTKAEQHVHALLGSETLQHASTWADEVKHGPFTDATRAYAARNKNHASNHFADIPIEEKSYSANSIGASKDDVVHTINRCIAVLKSGKDSATLTQVEALKVLVHLLGDVHQPLHVGAVYLDKQGNLVEPKTAADVKADSTIGGNDIDYQGNLHSYWDDKTVAAALKMEGVTSPKGFADKVAKTPPSVAQGNAKKWADEMMPQASQAYGQLKIGPQQSKVVKKKTVIFWPATTAKPAQYNGWAAKTVDANLKNAGVRLATLLQQIWH